MQQVAFGAVASTMIERDQCSSEHIRAASISATKEYSTLSNNYSRPEEKKERKKNRKKRTPPAAPPKTASLPATRCRPHIYLRAFVLSLSKKKTKKRSACTLPFGASCLVPALSLTAPFWMLMLCSVSAGKSFSKRLTSWRENLAASCTLIPPHNLHHMLALRFGCSLCLKLCSAIFRVENSQSHRKWPR